jgi:sugar (pentulose or hexulose) kinase
MKNYHILLFLLLLLGCKSKKNSDPLLAPYNLRYASDSLVVALGQGAQVAAPMVSGTGTITVSASSSPATSLIQTDTDGKIFASSSLSSGRYSISVVASNSVGTSNFPNVFTLIVR